MGHEICGKIVSTRTGGGRFSVGQSVVIFPLIPCRKCEACRMKRWTLCNNYDYYGSRRDGGFQEYLAVPEWNLLPIPQDVDLRYACLCEPIAVGVHAVQQAHFDKSRGRAVVLGAGLIGSVIANLLKTDGYETSVVDRNSFKLTWIEQFGHRGIAVGEAVNFEKHFDLVFEASGAPEMFRLSLKLCRPRGNLIWVGNIQGNLNLETKETSSILRKELSIRGVWNSDYQQGFNDDWSRSLNFVRSTCFISRVVSHRIGLEEVPLMLEEMWKIKSQHYSHEILKVVVDLNS
jgi:threonine dehydrogenase-like Zn-dependent dehydrogenase